MEGSVCYFSPKKTWLAYTVFSGTGKTLVARALANECSSSDTKVAFFMRKGADCLSKWVGESERQLRLLFDQVDFLVECLYSFCIIKENQSAV